jgi:enoyl-CoA hydratase/carnithine racemase
MENLSLEGLDFKTTLLDIKNNIMTITLNRPEKKNALNNVMMTSLIMHLPMPNKKVL